MQLLVNGVEKQVAVSPDDALLWVLRDDVGDTGAKYGCGVGQCGACMVLVDGLPQPSCLVPVSDVTGSRITTPSGIANDAVGRSVQEALIVANAGQCGYCLPGIVVTLTFLLSRGESPGEDELARALDAHLCRCGAHPRILRAATQLAGAGRD